MEFWTIAGITLYALFGLFCAACYIGETADRTKQWYQYLLRFPVVLWSVIAGPPLTCAWIVCGLVKGMLLWAYKVGKDQS